MTDLMRMKNTFICCEGNNLIGISACDYRKAPVVFQLMKDDVNPTPSLRITNNEYYVSNCSYLICCQPGSQRDTSCQKACCISIKVQN